MNFVCVFFEESFSSKRLNFGKHHENCEKDVQSNLFQKVIFIEKNTGWKVITPNSYHCYIWREKNESAKCTATHEKS
jgi:hypothetical protein